jgi:hypothetical protein
LISIPCAAKKPCLMPRSSGSPLAIGSVSTVIVVSCARRVELAAVPPKIVSAASAPATVAIPRIRARRGPA